MASSCVTRCFPDNVINLTGFIKFNLFKLGKRCSLIKEVAAPVSIKQSTLIPRTVNCTIGTELLKAVYENFPLCLFGLPPLVDFGFVRENYFV